MGTHEALAEQWGEKVKTERFARRCPANKQAFPGDFEVAVLLNSG
jgi:hypothetical protein